MPLGPERGGGLTALLRHGPVRVPPEARIRDTLIQIDAARAGMAVIVDPAQRPLGVLTLHDVIERAVHEQRTAAALDAALGAIRDRIDVRSDPARGAGLEPATSGSKARRSTD